MFKYLSVTAPYPKNSYEPKMASERAKYCVESLATIAKKHLEKQLKEEKGKEDKHLQFEAERSKVEEEEKRTREENQRQKQEEEEEINRKRLEIQELAMQAVSKASEVAVETKVPSPPSS